MYTERLVAVGSHFHNIVIVLSQIRVLLLAAAAAKSLQLCPTLCDPIDGSPPGSPVPGILRARTLERVAISFSNAWKWKVKLKSLSVSDPQRPHGLQPSRLLRPWDFPGKSTGVGCHRLLWWCLAHHLKKEQHLKVSPPIPTTKDTYSYTYQVVTAHDSCTIPPSSKRVRLKNLWKVTGK